MNCCELLALALELQFSGAKLHNFSILDNCERVTPTFPELLLRHFPVAASLKKNAVVSTIIWIKKKTKQLSPTKIPAQLTKNWKTLRMIILKMIPRIRTQAKFKGEQYYFSGVDCPHSSMQTKHLHVQMLILQMHSF